MFCALPKNVFCRLVNVLLIAWCVVFLAFVKIRAMPQRITLLQLCIRIIPRKFIRPRMNIHEHSMRKCTRISTSFPTVGVKRHVHVLFCHTMLLEHLVMQFPLLLLPPVTELYNSLLP
jgi:hypothetical protein